MTYRCPLCLKHLRQRDKLARQCIRHPEYSETFDCGPLIAFKIFCPDMDCQRDDDIENGVFLRHVDCEERNPFWEDTRVVLDGKSNETTATFNIEFESGQTRPTQIQHWLLGALRNLPRNAPEMWFPLLLLRATSERDGRRRVGRLIELAGARNAGKTILALQAMNPHTYSPANNAGAVYINSYIFSKREGAREGRHFRSFIEALHLNTLLRRGSKEIFLPEGTPHGVRNLRVAFIRPSELILPIQENTVKAHTGRLLRMSLLAGRRFVESDLVTALREWFGAPALRGYWHTLAFYDKSGEVDENEDVAIEMLDKVAVVVNAGDLFESNGDRSESGKSIEVAVQRINKAKQRRQLCYLVITQIDRVKDRMEPADWAAVQRLADNLANVGKDPNWFTSRWRRLFPRARSSSHLLLEKWLSGDDLDNKRLLKERLDDVAEIFFIWTDNLPTSRVPTLQSKLPKSHGLAKFVCRCLDIEWEQIYRNQR